MFDIFVRYLRHVNESVLMNADVDERAEIYDVSDYSRQLHAFFQVVHVEYVVAQDGRREIFTQVASGFNELFYDVRERRRADAELFTQLLASLLFYELGRSAT